MPFLETPRFPEAISRGAIGGPGFLTDVVIVESGQERRNQRRSLELGTWEVSHAARLPAAYRPLQAFFRVAAGRANGFRFKDWSDFECSITQGIFTMVTATTFQMWKRYTFGAFTYDRKIQKPISPAVVTGGVGGATTYTNGIHTVVSGTPTAWSGQFDVPCRFDTDVMHADIIDRSGGELIIGWSSIPVVEIKL